jgi:hypothetical protein
MHDLDIMTREVRHRHQPGVPTSITIGEVLCEMADELTDETKSAFGEVGREFTRSSRAKGITAWGVTDPNIRFPDPQATDPHSHAQFLVLGAIIYVAERLAA